MSDTPQSTTPLRAGTPLGPNHIVRWLGDSETGSFYEVTFGTTTHVYGLFVLSPELGLDVEGLASVVDRLASVSHPCLSKPFACGSDGGALWIRSELTTGVPFGAFDLPSDTKERVWPRGEMVIHAGRLRELCRGAVPQKLLYPLVADLLEGLACLHQAGLMAGPLSLESVVFHKARHGRGIVARWVGYGLLALSDRERARRMTVLDDVAAVGKLIRLLLCGDAGLLPAAAWREWETFLAGATGTAEGYADGAAMYRAFAELLDARGLAHELRQPALPPPPVVVSGAESEARKRREHERRQRVGTRRHRHGGSSESGSGGLSMQVGPAFKVLGMLVTLCVIGYGAFWIASRDMRLRRDGRVGESRRDPSQSEAAGAAVKIAYWDLSRAELEALQEKGDTLATVRLAFLTAMGDDTHPPDETRGAELAKTGFDILQQRLQDGQTDADALCLMGHVLLTGLGVEANAAKGRELLEQAIKSYNHPRAMELLGDYLASGIDGAASDDVAALGWWQKSVDATETWTARTAECADKAVAFVLGGRGLPRGDATELIKWIERIARLRHPSAILAMGLLTLEGKLLPLDEPRAMNWFRSAAMNGSGEGMRRMAWMFERGVGTPQSDTSAAIWYRRAALAGDAEAMELLAQMISAGRGDEVPDAAVEAEWRRKAAEARATAQTKTQRGGWWKPGLLPKAPETPAVPGASPDAVDVKLAPESGTDPVPGATPLPPVDPGLIRPGTGPLLPMG